MSRASCAALAIATLVCLFAAQAHAATVSTTYTSSAYSGLFLDGRFVGFAHSASGGEAVGSVVWNAQSGGQTTTMLAGITVTPLVVEVPLNLDASLFEWITKSMTGDTKPATVQIVHYDGNNIPQHGRTLSGALLSEVTFPKLSGADKSSAFLKLTIRGAAVRYFEGGPKASAPSGTVTSKWLSSNYRLTIDGLPGQRVSSIGPITWSRAINSATVGAFRDAATSTGNRRVEAFTVTISEVDGRAWRDWLQNFVVNGKTTDRRRARLSILAGDLTTELAQITLDGVGIFSAFDSETPGKIEVGLFANTVNLSM